MVRCQSFAALLRANITLASVVVVACPVSAGQIPLTPESVIGGSGAWNAERWDSGQFSTGLVADNQSAFRIEEPEQNSGDANGGFWLGKEGDEEEFFVLDLGREYGVRAFELFQTHNAAFNNGSTNGYEIYAANAVEPIDNPNEPQVGGMDLIDPVLIASGNLPRQVIETDPIDRQWVELPDVSSCVRYLRFNAVGPLHNGQNAIQRSVGLNEIKVFSDSPVLQAGDADMDLEVEPLDYVQISQAAKYLTGEPATWGEGDWDGAPGGEPGFPPPGDGVFNQLDIIASIDPGFTGPYGDASACDPDRQFTGIRPNAVAPDGQLGDDQTSIFYDAKTGEVAVDAPRNSLLTSINIDSTVGIFTADPARNLGSIFDTDYNSTIFKATFGTSFGSISFGDVAQTDLSQEFLLNDLKVAGSLAGGGPLGNVDLVYTTCEFFEQDFTGADFNGRDLTGTCFSRALLDGVSFEAANVTNARFDDARLAKADFRGSNLAGASFRRVTLNDANLGRANAVGANFNQAKLSNADLSHANLKDASFSRATLRNADLSNADLEETNFTDGTLAGADLSGALVKGTWFGRTTSHGFTQEQLYSTASYRAKDLEGIVLFDNDLSDWNFAGQNLVNASFWGATLARTDLSFADLRDAGVQSLHTATTRNAILPDGSIDGLELQSEEGLVVRDHEMAITVNKSMSLAETSTLELRFEDATWGSTINVAARVTPNIGGTLALNVTADADTGAMLDVTLPVFNWNEQLPPGESFDRIVGQPGVVWDTDQLYTTGSVRLLGVAELLPGDANRDLMFDQQDLVQVLQAGKYLTGQSATWGEGDWNGAPGGWWGSPPAGDSVFDQLDIVAALSAGTYLTGANAGVKDNRTQGDRQTSVLYNAKTGELAVEAPAGRELTSINIDSASGIFAGEPALNLGGGFDNDADDNIFKAVFGSSFGSLSFGNVAQSGLSEEFVLSDLTVVGSLAGGGGLGNVDLIYVPEPSTLVLLTILVAMLATGRGSWRTHLSRKG